jgi:type II secretory pathway pseudopilin PulG
MLHAPFRRRSGDLESGAALLIVIVLTLVMLTGVSVALTGASSGLRQANAAQNATRALDAAYAGVQDYIAKLNSDATYTQYGNPAAKFSSGSVVKLPPTTNAAFGVAPTDVWGTVPGAGGAATFRYEIDNSQYNSSGLLRVRVTGRFGSFTKTLVATVQQQGFINYLYFTNYETLDPSITGTSANCAAYLWAGRNATACPAIRFTAKDTLGGPVRSNDTFTVCGATFNGPVVSSNPKLPLIATPSPCADGPGIYKASPPSSQPVLSMPATNTAMKAQTYSDLTPNPGCLYTGPTQIRFNSGGTMTVVSPWSKYTAVQSDGTGGTNNAAVCGAPSDLHSTSGATVPVPPNNLIFVQSVPGTSTDANYTSTASVPSVTAGSYKCLGADGATAIGGSATSAGWSFQNGVTTLGYPVANEDPSSFFNNGSSWDTTTPAYGCRDGDAYISGTENGKVTVASDNFVYVTGDLKYADRADDLVGVVGNNGVFVWNPMQNQTLDGTTGAYKGGTGSALLPSNREIDAAVLSPAHTFMVQNYNLGSPRGTLTMFGSVAQNYRGTVGLVNTSTGAITTGYTKSYTYDGRLISTTPPYYLKPTTASFRVAAYASTLAAYTSTGVAQ